MTQQFSTGDPVGDPAYTADGAPYCPVDPQTEQSRRSVLAISAAMAVLLVGAGFLTYSIITTPASEQLSAPAGVSVSIDTTALEEMRAQIPADPPRDLSAAVEGALANSRTARANAAPVLSVANSGEQQELSPRLKPAQITNAAASRTKSDGFAPSLKPAPARQAGTSLIPEPAASIRPIRLGALFMASAEDRPAPFFFQSDIEPVSAWRLPAPVALAADVQHGLSERLIKITKGENFVDALKRADIRAQDRNEAAYAFGKEYNLRRLQPGQEFALTLAWPNQTLFQLASSRAQPQARLLGLEFRADAKNRIRLRRDETGALTAEKSAVKLISRTMEISGAINGSLYVSAKAQGATNQAIADLANIFAYDVDFQREIFGGDEFEAIFDVFYDSQGRVVGSGDIHFARMKWRGRTKEKAYYRFASEHGGVRADYYDASGQSAKRLLMKTPIDGARLSSGFGSRRHPISGYRRQHKGVDFAARRGTPIYAAGDGIVERANRYGGYGNYVRIRHANGYKTAYAHMKGFRKGIRSGKRVEQGDIIGYVGSTGASTGPHLHYEVHLNGKATNPQKLKIATGTQLKGAELDRFKAQRDVINAMRLPEDEGTGLFAKKDRDESSL